MSALPAEYLQSVIPEFSVIASCDAARDIIYKLFCYLFHHLSRCICSAYYIGSFVSKVHQGMVLLQILNT